MSPESDSSLKSPSYSDSDYSDRCLSEDFTESFRFPTLSDSTSKSSFQFDFSDLFLAFELSHLSDSELEHSASF